MRTRLIIACLAVIPALYLLARPSSRDGKPHAARVPVASELPVKVRDQLTAGERSRDQLQARLAELEHRLHDVERAAPVEAPAPEAAHSAQSELSEADVAVWMNEHLRSQADVALTAEAASQIHATIALAKRTDLHVENLSCGERFCRASFYEDTGERPVIQDLYGAPPITGEGFTIEEADGRLGVYFGRNGARVADLREEALLATAP